MLRGFTTFDRRLFVLAVTLLLLFSYLLYDDSLIMKWVTVHGAKIAEITLTVKDVRLKSSGDFRWNAAKSGTIHMGDSVFTGPGSQATITLSDNSVIEIQENSLIVFNTVNDQPTLILKSGEVKGNTQQIKIDTTAAVIRKPTSLPPAPPRPIITVPKAYTKLTIQVNPDETLAQPPKVHVNWEYQKSMAHFQLQISKDSQFKAVEFSETTSARDFSTPDLLEGSHFIRVREVPLEDQKTSWSKSVQVELVFNKPEKIEKLAAPDLIDAHIHHIIGGPRPLVLAWKPVEGAASYIVHIDKDQQFKEPKKFKTTDTRMLIKEVTPGRFAFRVIPVSASKALGDTSLPGTADAVILPPVLYPVKGKEVYADSEKDEGPASVFPAMWSKVPQTDKYIVQVATNPEFKEADQFETKSNDSALKVKKAGTYYWRVRPMKKTNAAVTDFSKTGMIHYGLIAPLTRPALIEPIADMTLFFQKRAETPFWLAWKAIPVAKFYVVQLATDPEFKTTVLSTQSTSARLFIKDSLPQGDLYWRVRAEDGPRHSDWSEPRKMSVFAGRIDRNGDRRPSGK